MCNDHIIKWHLSHGADPNISGEHGFTPMRFAAREASLASLKHLIRHGGIVEGSDLVAQAAIGHSWGRKDRLEVIDFLLTHGASINAMAQEHIATSDPKSKTNDGGQTAFHVAKISGDVGLASWLLERGADLNIEPINGNLIEEFPYLGEEFLV
jgi:ankyrin repeat protein